MTIIRASSLPSYADCPRRTAARVFRSDVLAAGYSLAERPPGIGAAVGTATHAGAAAALKHKVNEGVLAPDRDSEELAMVALRDATTDGVTLDDVSPTMLIAERQVLRQLRTWRAQVAPQIVPTHVEVRINAEFGDVTVSGQPDVAVNGAIHDLKTGRVQRANGAQYGTYSLLWRAHGHDVSALIEDYVERAPLKREQPPAISTEIDVAEAETAATAIIKRMTADLDAFRCTGDPWSFVANPASMLCGEKWCPAWGTDFCRAHKGQITLETLKRTLDT